MIAFLIHGLLAGCCIAGVIIPIEDPPAPAVIVRIGDRTITLEMVDDLLASRFGDQQEVDEASQQLLRAAALSKLVERQYALQQLLKLGAGRLQDAISTYQRGATAELKRIDPTAELTDIQTANLEWQFAWNDYLKRQLTEENLRKFFAVHAARYDGTQAKVRQVFLPHDADPPAEPLLKKLRAEIEAGAVTFADAARQHSQSPSAANDGLVGWVAEVGDLPREVYHAVMAVDEPALVGPVQSSLGWHLLSVEELRKGKTPFDELVDYSPLRRDAADFLFSRLVSDGRKAFEEEWISADWKPKAVQ